MKVSIFYILMYFCSVENMVASKDSSLDEYLQGSAKFFIGQAIEKGNERQVRGFLKLYPALKSDSHILQMVRNSKNQEIQSFFLPLVQPVPASPVKIPKPRRDGLDPELAALLRPAAKPKKTAEASPPKAKRVTFFIPVTQKDPPPQEKKLPRPKVHKNNPSKRKDPEPQKDDFEIEVVVPHFLKTKEGTYALKKDLNGEDKNDSEPRLYRSLLMIDPSHIAPPQSQQGARFLWNALIWNVQWFFDHMHKDELARLFPPTLEMPEEIQGFIRHFTYYKDKVADGVSFELLCNGIPWGFLKAKTLVALQEKKAGYLLDDLIPQVRGPDQAALRELRDDWVSEMNEKRKETRLPRDKPESWYLNLRAKPENILLQAIRKGLIDDIRWMIEWGISLNVTFNEGKCTPLMEAIKVEKMDIIKLLLQQGVDPNWADSEGGTAFTQGIRVGKLPYLIVLQKAGASLDHLHKDGSTYLHMAVVTQNFLVIQYLLRCGLDPLIKSHDGKTSVDLAIQYKNPDITKMLEDAIKSTESVVLPTEDTFGTENVQEIRS